TSASTGSLTVTILPQEAIAAGAQWRVDSGIWQNSGATVSSLAVGEHTVNFKDITGGTKPSDKTVTIQSDKTTIISGSYTQNKESSGGCFIITITD
ncbi:MAG: hypothetical protein HQK76_19690, partial [Desulfobacterales bacterium]|nr:hypothetical protein [Desulfobacterales bacterium]